MNLAFHGPCTKSKTDKPTTSAQSEMQWKVNENKGYIQWVKYTINVNYRKAKQNKEKLN